MYGGVDRAGATSWLAIGKYTSMEGLGLAWLDDLDFEHRAKEGLLFKIPYSANSTARVRTLISLGFVCIISDL